MSVFIRTHGQLYLVAVTVGVFCPDNRQHRHIQAAQPRKSVPHKACLGLTFGCVFNMPQSTAAAGAGHRAVALPPCRAWGQKFFQSGKGVAFHRFDNAHLGHIAGGRIGDKQCQAVLVGYAAAVTGQGFYCNGQNLIFRKCHYNSSAAVKIAGTGVAACGSLSIVARYLLGGTPFTFLNTREK